jgi:hypothetical protein
MLFQDEVAKCEDSLISGLLFFLGYDRFLVAGSKLGHLFFKNAFLLPCTGN